MLIVVALYYATLITLLYPYLGEMKIAVPVYGIVISFMLLLALHMLFISNKSAGQMMMAGAILFVISDSILAINKFYSPLQNAGILIMLRSSDKDHVEELDSRTKAETKAIGQFLGGYSPLTLEVYQDCV